MIRDIRKCSPQYIQSVLSHLNQYQDYVFWIRSADMLEQIYISDAFTRIWGRDSTVVYQIPLIWFSYLAPDVELKAMMKLQERHKKGYHKIEENYLLYQITRPDDDFRYLQSYCIKAVDFQQQEYVIGFCKDTPHTLWQEKYSRSNVDLSDVQELLRDDFLNLLQKNFGFCEVKIQAPCEIDFLHICCLINQHYKISLSLRETECLYHVCLGKMSKEIATVMSISTRTVERHIDNIRNKTSCGTRARLISQFGACYSALIKN